MRNFNCRGFNLIELMIAITLSATIIATMVSSFSQLYNVFLYNTKFLSTNGELLLAMQVIKKDTANAGTFGSFSFHHENSALYQVVRGAKGGSCASPTCQYDASTAGVKSFDSDVDGVLSGFPLMNGSQILRIQQGGKEAYAVVNGSDSLCEGSRCVLKKCDKTYYLNYVRFANSDIETKANGYILASANRIYGLDYPSDAAVTIFNSLTTGSGFALDFASNCDDKSSLPRIAVESYVTGAVADIFEPDIHTMELMNLQTDYYFVSSGNSTYGAGLYRLHYDGVASNVPQPVLISRVISQLEVSYLLDVSTTFNRVVLDNTSTRFVTCNSSDMQSSTNKKCFNKWNNIVAVNISLTAKGQSSSAAIDQFEQTVTETVSWKL